MAFGLGLIIASLAGLSLLVGTPIAILISALFGIPAGELPIIGGLATLGMDIFGIIWELSKLAANLVMVILALFLGYALFTGKLDEWIESTVERDMPDNKSKNAPKAGKDTTVGTANKSKPDKKRRL
jgi:hypothetical protein